MAPTTLVIDFPKEFFQFAMLRMGKEIYEEGDIWSLCSFIL